MSKTNHEPVSLMYEVEYKLRTSLKNTKEELEYVNKEIKEFTKAIKEQSKEATSLREKRNEWQVLPTKHEYELVHNIKHIFKTRKEKHEAVLESMSDDIRQIEADIKEKNGINAFLKLKKSELLKRLKQKVEEPEELSMLDKIQNVFTSKADEEKRADISEELKKPDILPEIREKLKKELFELDKSIFHNGLEKKRIELIKKVEDVEKYPVKKELLTDIIKSIAFGLGAAVRNRDDETFSLIKYIMSSGNISAVPYMLLGIRGALKNELGERYDEDMNKVIQSKLIDNIIQEPDIWDAIDIEKSNIAKSILLYQKEIDGVVRDIIEEPSAISTESKLSIVTSIFSNKHAIEIIKNILSDKGKVSDAFEYDSVSQALINYVKSSEELKRQFGSVGVDQERVSQLLPYMLVIAEKFLNYSDKVGDILKKFKEVTVLQQNKVNDGQKTSDLKPDNKDVQDKIIELEKSVWELAGSLVADPEFLPQVSELISSDVTKGVIVDVLTNNTDIKAQLAKLGIPEGSLDGRMLSDFMVVIGKASNFLTSPKSREIVKQNILPGVIALLEKDLGNEGNDKLKQDKIIKLEKSVWELAGSLVADPEFLPQVSELISSDVTKGVIVDVLTNNTDIKAQLAKLGIPEGSLDGRMLSDFMVVIGKASSFLTSPKSREIVELKILPGVIALLEKDLGNEGNDKLKQEKFLELVDGVIELLSQDKQIENGQNIKAVSEVYGELQGFLEKHRKPLEALINADIKAQLAKLGIPEGSLEGYMPMLSDFMVVIGKASNFLTSPKSREIVKQNILPGVIALLEKDLGNEGNDKLKQEKFLELVDGVIELLSQDKQIENSQNIKAVSEVYVGLQGFLEKHRDPLEALINAAVKKDVLGKKLNMDVGKLFIDALRQPKIFIALIDTYEAYKHGRYGAAVGTGIKLVWDSKEVMDILWQSISSVLTVIWQDKMPDFMRRYYVGNDVQNIINDKAGPVIESEKRDLSAIFNDASTSKEESYRNASIVTKYSLENKCCKGLIFYGTKFCNFDIDGFDFRDVRFGDKKGEWSAGGVSFKNSTIVNTNFSGVILGGKINLDNLSIDWESFASLLPSLEEARKNNQNITSSGLKITGEIEGPNLELYDRFKQTEFGKQILEANDPLGKKGIVSFADKVLNQSKDQTQGNYPKL